MPIDITIDDARRRAYFRIVGDMPGAEVTAALTAIVEERPELADFDYVYDVRDHAGVVLNHDIAMVGELFAGARSSDEKPASTSTVFISRDPNLAGWARVMDYQIQGRRHVVVTRPEEADDYLDRARA